MDKKALIEELTKRLGNKKPALLENVRRDIETYIADQGKDCLALVEKTPNGDLNWNVQATPAYAARLLAFCRSRPHKGHAIDSALTQPITKIVAGRFTELFQEDQDLIASALLRFILEDKLLSKQLVDTLVASTEYGTDSVRNRLASFILEQVQLALHTSKGQVVGSLVTKTVTATISSPVGAKIAALLIKALSIQIKAIIAKIVASGALKTVIFPIVSKYVVVLVSGALVKFIAVKFGIGPVAAIAWVLIPVLVIYLGHQVYTFPNQLAKKVGAKVSDELDGKYADLNAEILDSVTSKIFDTFLSMVARPVAEDSDLQKALVQYLRQNV